MLADTGYVLTVDNSFFGRLIMQNTHKGEHYGIFKCHKTIQTHQIRVYVTN